MEPVASNIFQKKSGVTTTRPHLSNYLWKFQVIAKRIIAHTIINYKFTRRCLAASYKIIAAADATFNDSALP